MSVWEPPALAVRGITPAVAVDTEAAADTEQVAVEALLRVVIASAVAGVAEAISAIAAKVAGAAVSAVATVDPALGGVDQPLTDKHIY